MRLSIVTITCRREPLFKKMADTIFANLKSSDKSIDLTWICVDDRLWHESADDRRESLLAAVAGRFPVVHTAPKSSVFRGPDKTCEMDLPDHNGARNTGLALALAADAEYVMFLDDCTLISQSVFSVLKVAAEKDAGLRVQILTKRDLNVPMSGAVKEGEGGGLHLVPCAETTVAGGCFGAPASYLRAIEGFDEAYGGEAGREDIDAFIRMSRLGLKWLTSKRCAAIQLTNTHTKDDVSLVQQAHRGNSNQRLYAALQKDRRRTLPSNGQEKLASLAASLGRLEGDVAPAPAGGEPPTELEG